MNPMGVTSGNAGEGPNNLQASHVNSHQAFGEPTDGRVPNEPPNERAADTVAGAYIKPEHISEAEDEKEEYMW